MISFKKFDFRSLESTIELKCGCVYVMVISISALKFSVIFTHKEEKRRELTEFFVIISSSTYINIITRVYYIFTLYKLIVVFRPLVFVSMTSFFYCGLPLNLGGVVYFSRSLPVVLPFDNYIYMRGEKKVEEIRTLIYFVINVVNNPNIVYIDTPSVLTPGGFYKCKIRGLG